MGQAYSLLLSAAFVIAVEPVLSLFLELLLPQAMKNTATKKAADKKIIFFILLLF
jgi:hypothetical protein